MVGGELRRKYRAGLKRHVGRDGSMEGLLWAHAVCGNVGKAPTAEISVGGVVGLGRSGDMRAEICRDGRGLIRGLCEVVAEAA